MILFTVIQWRVVGFTENLATLETAYKMLGQVATDRYSKLPIMYRLIDMLIKWLIHFSGFYKLVAWVNWSRIDFGILRSKFHQNWLVIYWLSQNTADGFLHKHHAEKVMKFPHVLDVKSWIKLFLCFSYIASCHFEQRQRYHPCIHPSRLSVSPLENLYTHGSVAGWMKTILKRWLWKAIF